MGVIDKKMIVNLTVRKFLELPPEWQKAIAGSVMHKEMAGRIWGEMQLCLLFLLNALELIDEVGIEHKPEILALPAQMLYLDEMLSPYFRENLKPTGQDDSPFQIDLLS